MNMQDVIKSAKPVVKSGDVPDYTEHEASFKQDHSKFLQSISIANKELSEIFSFAESVDSKQVATKEEKSSKKVEEISEVDVELSDVTGPMSGQVAKKPALYREEFPLSSDPFDAIVSPTSTTKDIEKELFGETSPAPKSEEKKEAPKVLKTASVEPKEEPSKLSEKPSEAFDIDRFNPTKKAIDQLLSQVEVGDIDAKLKSLSSYAVRLELDHARENPDRLWDLMVEVRNKMDSLHALIVELGPLENTFDQGIKRLRTIGNTCSKGSSKEKRDGEVEILISDLLNRQNEINRVYETAKFSYEHLKGQQEMLSRLVSFLAMRIGPEQKIHNQSETEAIVVSKPQNQAEVQQVEVPKAELEKMRKPIEAPACASKHASLESFDISKVSKPQSGENDGATHVIDW